MSVTPEAVEHLVAAQQRLDAEREADSARAAAIAVLVDLLEAHAEEGTALHFVGGRRHDYREALLVLGVTREELAVAAGY